MSVSSVLSTDNHGTIIGPGFGNAEAGPTCDAYAVFGVAKPSACANPMMYNVLGPTWKGVRPTLHSIDPPTLYKLGLPVKGYTCGPSLPQFANDSPWPMGGALGASAAPVPAPVSVTAPRVVPLLASAGTSSLGSASDDFPNMTHMSNTMTPLTPPVDVSPLIQGVPIQSAPPTIMAKAAAVVRAAKSGSKGASIASFVLVGVIIAVVIALMIYLNSVQH